MSTIVKFAQRRVAISLRRHNRAFVGNREKVLRIECYENFDEFTRQLQATKRARARSANQQPCLWHDIS
jgi:hypothetical protein